MNRLLAYWHSLSQQDQTAAIIGVVVTVVGGIVLAVLGALGKLSSAGLKRLFGQSSTLQPHQPLPQPITIKFETPQLVSSAQLSPQTLKEKKPAPSPEIPRPAAVDFVPRRDKEGRDILAQLKERLTPQSHQLVILWGPGGVGKTRIANEAAHSLREAFENQVVWVSADGLPDFGLNTLLDGIATQLDRKDLRQLAPEPKKERVRELIASAPPLIVLDNFETIGVEEQKHCTTFLAQEASCPALITTRWMILSNYAHNISIDAMSMSEAHQFLEELVAQAPDAEPFTETTRKRIIERSAANPLVMQWVVQQIVLTEEPEVVLDNLSQGEGDAAERVFDNSFELGYLGDDGRAALLALSLFSPSASRESLAQVAGFGEDLERLNLAAKSLGALRLVKTTHRGKRLLIEGLTRELAKARLARDGQAEEYRRRFVSYFVSYTRAHAEATSEDYETLEIDRENIISAVDAAMDLKDWKNVQAVGYPLGSPVGGMLSVHGYWDQAIKLNEQAVKAAFESGSENEVAAFKHNLAIMHWKRGELEIARRLYNESLDIDKRLGNQGGIAISLHQLASLAQYKGELEEARRLYNESLEITKTLGHQDGIASTLHELARLAQGQGELEEARRLYNQSLEITKRLGKQGGIAITLHQLAILAQDKGELEEARRLYNESLEIAKGLGDQGGIAITLHQLARLAQDKGELEEARLLYTESLEIKKRLGDQGGIASTLHQLAMLAQGQGEFEEARRLYTESLEIKKRLGDQNGIAITVHQLATLAQGQGELEEARRLYTESLEIAKRLGDQDGIAGSLHQLGRLEELEERKEGAAQLFREALTIWERLKSADAELARRSLARVTPQISVKN
jgi:tetratricopeptide (TPR) repeat protein